MPLLRKKNNCEIVICQDATTKEPIQPTANFLFQGENQGFPIKTQRGPSTGKKLSENSPIDSCDKQRTGKKSKQKRADV